MSEITIELPEGPKKEIDYEHVKKLNFSAVYEALEDLKKLHLPAVKWHVYRGDERSSGSIEIDIPFYRDKIVWEHIDTLSRAPAAIALTDYLWEKGAFKKTLTGPAPDKQAWARFVYGDLVHGPILGALNETSLLEAVKIGAVVPWSVEEDILRLFIESTIEDHLPQKGSLKIRKAICFLPMLNIETDSDITLGLGITIKVLSITDRLIAMTRYQDEFIWSDIHSAPWMAKYVVEIELPILSTNRIGEQSFATCVGEHLDLMKWAFMQVAGTNRPIKEGKIFIVDKRGAIVDRHQRDLSSSNYTGPLNKEQLKEASKIMEHLNKIADESDAAAIALWHFGRACNTSLDRDSLLEAAIGIDAILVDSASDSVYRFWLHAGAILSEALPQTENEKYFRIAKELYDNRSKLAHGKKTKKLELTHADNARKLLSDILMAVYILDKDGRLPKISQGSLPKRIERFVVEKLAK